MEKELDIDISFCFSRNISYYLRLKSLLESEPSVTPLL